MNFAYSLRGQIGSEDMKHLKETGEVKVRTRDPYLKVDYAFIEDSGELRKKVDFNKNLTKGKR